MLTTILFSQALLLACAVQGVIAAPPHGLLSSGACVRPDAYSTNLLLSVTSKFRCNSGASYERTMIATASLKYAGSALTSFGELETCQNIETFKRSYLDDKFSAEHRFGPFNVGGRKCCYSLRHAFGILLDMNTRQSVVALLPDYSKVVEGCSARGGDRCPDTTQFETCAAIIPDQARICAIAESSGKCGLETALKGPGH
ncbi:hypothetical protein IWZ03DRAFT_369473 [Phyllosticta citriasiana]|uniref:Uncharacterized protein n=1 Tax=Phyllosticta citriasiana TaxID=595635 RepID=A0ABR1KUE7_9PEZI